MPPERLQRFFSRHEKGYQVSRQIRDSVVFARHNLGKDPPFSRLDLITCRNVLIYMQVALQRRVLRIFHYALNPDAFMLLGSSESVGDTADLFSMVDRRLKLFQKKNTASAAVFNFGFGSRFQEERAQAAHGGTPRVDHRPLVTVQQLADRKVIEKYAPPGVLLNEDFEVIQFRGQTGPFLSPAPGSATFNVFKLARPELLPELRTAIAHANDEGILASSAPISLGGDHPQQICIDVVPVRDGGAQRKCLLVSFRRVDGSPAVATPAREARPTQPRDLDLERELLTTKEYLTSTVQELEATNEELQSSNEELQSSNEELQSSNEELETSKEELQSTNEELATVNEELQNRMLQLAVSNDDLQNLIVAGTAAVIIVGVDLRIRRFTDAAAKLLNLIATDVGRPIAYLGDNIKPAQIEQAVNQAIRTMTVSELKVRTNEGHLLSMRATPHRTADQAIRGAVVEFIVPPDRKAEAGPVAEFEGRILSSLADALLLINGKLEVAWANRRFFDRYHFGSEIIGLGLEKVWPAIESESGLFAALNAVVAEGAPFDALPVAEPFGLKDTKPTAVSGVRVPADAGRPAMALITLREQQ